MPLSPAWPTERCSSVAYSGWKKNRDQLHSMLVSSEVPESIPPFSWSTACSSYRGSEDLSAKPRTLPEVTAASLFAKM